MGIEVERQDTRKAMAYDLIQILEAKPEKESYTTEEFHWKALSRKPAVL